MLTWNHSSNFDNSVQRLKAWVSDRAGAPAGALTPGSSTAHLVGVGLSMSAATAPGAAPGSGSSSADLTPLTSSQKKRIKQYLKRCRMHPRHSQLNLEGNGKLWVPLPEVLFRHIRLAASDAWRSAPVNCFSVIYSAWVPQAGARIVGPSEALNHPLEDESNVS